MSSALVRQALELVDQEDSVEAKRAARRSRPRRAGQDQKHLFKNKSKKPKAPVKSKEQLTEENINKLLKLSKPVAQSSVVDKIVERAIKRKPLADTIEVKQDDHKSILFPEGETFEDFEKELFCS
ncbi:hypothetical protein PYW08_010257 [Mythimna loreyi]|uniref:Uncharacterized protein n=1 Tax=Mythimna loreyi TaxID=667449 RepID=A0ACC2Q9P2_9NEOP|nr:hypothetical protein PYW08_010257 [Mythimna loreyi]